MKRLILRGLAAGKAYRACGGQNTVCAPRHSEKLNVKIPATSNKMTVKAFFTRVPFLRPVVRFKNSFKRLVAGERRM
jgi:hypothetical protein